MRKLIGAICVFLGAACLVCSVGFVVYNRLEDKNAGKSAEAILEDVKGMIEEKRSGRPTDNDVTEPPVYAGDQPKEMATVKVDGYDCIGILSIPVLDLELPVLTDWSYAKLKKAPCHYYGSCYEKNFVIAAHNYRAHFGRLSELQEGDDVIFTDVNGVARQYEVVLLETLPKEATEEMITGGFDLSLYTCNTSGAARVTVRCVLSGQMP